MGGGRMHGGTQSIQCPELVDDLLLQADYTGSREVHLHFSTRERRLIRLHMACIDTASPQ